MRRTTYLLTVVLALATAHGEAPSTEAIGDNEALAADTVRALDLEQRAIADWELEQSQQLIEHNKRDEGTALAKKAQERYRTVKDAYEAALARFPDNAKVNNYYGELLYDFFDQESLAVRHWKRASELDPNFAPPFINLGNYYTHLANFVDGLKSFEHAIELEPDNPDAYFYLTQVYLISWPDLEKHLGKTAPELYQTAMELSRKATELAPDDFQLARDYALNYFAGDRMDAKVDWTKAVKAWERALGLAPNPTMRFQCLLYEARAQIRAGDNEAAEKALLGALEIYPDNVTATNLLTKVRAAARPD